MKPKSAIAFFLFIFIASIFVAHIPLAHTTGKTAVSTAFAPARVDLNYAAKNGSLIYAAGPPDLYWAAPDAVSVWLSVDQNTSSALGKSSFFENDLLTSNLTPYNPGSFNIASLVAADDNPRDAFVDYFTSATSETNALASSHSVALDRSLASAANMTGFAFPNTPGLGGIPLELPNVLITPEPASSALIGLGLVSLGLLRKRKS